MAVGKQKKVLKKKAGKKKTADAFARKDWYDIRTPSYFETRTAGKTPVSRTVGTKIASDSLKGRVFEVNLGDLRASDEGFRKFKLVCEEVQGKNVLTNFYGMTFTKDKVSSLIKKWQNLIEVIVDAKTTDGYTIRVFVIAFTSKVKVGQTKKTAYAQSAQIRAIRKKIVDLVTAAVTKSDLKDFVAKYLLPETLNTEITKAAASIFPLQNVHVRKVKTLKTPKFDLTKLMDIHNETAEEGGAKVARVAPAAVEAVAGSGGRY